MQFSLFVSYILLCVYKVQNLQFYFTNEDTQKFSLEENQPEKTFVGRVKFNKHFEEDFRYSFSEKSPLFDIDSKNGDIITSAIIDLETLCPVSCPDKEYASIPLSVSIKKDKTLMTMIKVVITVVDVDDNFPKFDQRGVVIDVKEMIYRKNAIINLPSAKDSDILSKNREINYKISGDCSIFILEESKYQGPKLRLLADIDYETQKDYKLTLSAYHKHDDKISANLNVHIRVTNINDCAPLFLHSHYEVSVYEDVPIEDIIIQVNATDPDGDSLNYSLIQANSIFQIRYNGDVHVVRTLDYETQQSYSFIVQASDGEFVAETNLRILVLDVNDEAPIYTLNPAELIIDETNKSGILVGQITIFDRDSMSVNRGLQCTEPIHSSQALRFTTDSTSSDNILVYKLYTINPLDRELIPDGVVFTYLMCYDSGLKRQLHRNISIPLYVSDINDNSPYFGSQEYQVSVKENNEIGYRFYQIVARDADTGINGQIKYSLQSSIDADSFQIDSKSGWLKLMHSIDRETKGRYTIIILAHDCAPIGKRSGSTTLRINVLDVNDNEPHLVNAFELAIKENQPIGTYIGFLRAYDKDEGENARVIFQIIPKGSFKSFRITENGSMYSNQVFDREALNKVCTQIQLSDSSITNILTSQNTVCVSIIDENDNYPQIKLYENDKVSEIRSKKSNNSLDLYFNTDFVLKMSVREHPGFVLAIVKATDEDSNNNSQLSYYLEKIATDRDTQSVFDINIRSGSIVLNRPLHRDYIGTQNWKIIVEDSGKSPLKTGKNIMINILDIPSHQSRAETSKNKDDPQKPLIGNNLLVAVVLSIVSALLILLLISAIICIVKPCKKRNNYESHCYQSNFIPSLMFNDQTRHLVPNCTEKPKFEITGHMDGLWGDNMYNDVRMFGDINWKPSVISSTPNEYLLDNCMKSSQTNDYNSNARSFPICSVSGSVRLQLRNDEQRSDSGKGASDDDMSYIPRFITEPIYSSNVSGPLNYNSTNPVQMVQFPGCMFTCSSPSNFVENEPIRVAKRDSSYPPMPTYLSTNI